MKTEIVSVTLESMPQITAEEVAALKAKRDDPNFKIDYSDIPKLTDEQWKNAARRRFHQSPATRNIDSPAAEETARPA